MRNVFFDEHAMRLHRFERAFQALQQRDCAFDIVARANETPHYRFLAFDARPSRLDVPIGLS